MGQTDTTTPTPPDAAAVARLSDEALKEAATASYRAMTVEAARFVSLCAEVARREGYRSEGATSIEAWLVERTGMSSPSARTYAQVGAALVDLPHLAGALGAGAISFDKVRAVAAVATPESDAALAEAAKDLSVRQLVELARTSVPPSAASDTAAHQRRSVRLNEGLRTISAQLPEALFAEVRTALEARAAEVPTEAETPYDVRLADALVSLIRTGLGTTTTSTSPYVVVAHVPLEALGEAGAPSELFGELERGGLISAAVAQELLCGASVIVALDDAEGHTMYEGRARRFASATQRREILRRDRCCRFPGCSHVRFALAHHIRLWKPDHGPTDLDNLALLCAYHHGLVHQKLWSLSGNANEELTFIGPTGRVMTSRPSPLWTRVTSQRGRRGR